MLARVTSVFVRAKIDMNASGWIVVLLALALVVVATMGLAVHGRSRWDTLTNELVARAQAQRLAPRPARYDEALELAGLPAPVRRYFKAVLKDGAPIVDTVTVRHTGTFNLGEAVDRWRPFTSTQFVVTKRPGFVWDGRVRVLPGLNVFVHDAYVAGEGVLHPSIAGLYTLMDLRGDGDVAQGELMRFFAEAAWYPTALLPTQGVRWQAVDDTCAQATLADGANQQTLLFRFAPDGTIASVHADARGRMVQGRSVPTPWEGVWSDHVVRDGMRVPLRGEVAWITAQGRKPYWRGTIDDLSYGFAAP
jgi:hypothetical protein